MSTQEKRHNMSVIAIHFCRLSWICRSCGFVAAAAILILSQVKSRGVYGVEVANLPPILPLLPGMLTVPFVFCSPFAHFFFLVSLTHHILQKAWVWPLLASSPTSSKRRIRCGRCFFGVAGVAHVIIGHGMTS